MDLSQLFSTKLSSKYWHDSGMPELLKMHSYEVTLWEVQESLLVRMIYGTFTKQLTSSIQWYISFSLTPFSLKWKPSRRLRAAINTAPADGGGGTWIMKSESKVIVSEHTFEVYRLSSVNYTPKSALEGLLYLYSVVAQISSAQDAAVCLHLCEQSATLFSVFKRKTTTIHSSPHSLSPAQKLHCRNSRRQPPGPLPAQA